MTPLEYLFVFGLVFIGLIMLLIVIHVCVMLMRRLFDVDIRRVYPVDEESVSIQHAPVRSLQPKESEDALVVVSVGADDVSTEAGSRASSRSSIHSTDTNSETATQLDQRRAHSHSPRPSVRSNSSQLSVPQRSTQRARSYSPGLSVASSAPEMLQNRTLPTLSGSQRIPSKESARSHASLPPVGPRNTRSSSKESVQSYASLPPLRTGSKRSSSKESV